ncbi:MAG: DUF1810 domain-containing protein [Rubritepida sp.]|nr:DUF1810 domain-containing protein [Rubritepida sp.]
MGLERFVEAQAEVYPIVLAELRAATKQTHWMWFIFPQLRGLGTSAMARRYGIADLIEARDYLRHRPLGSRLLECTGLLLAAPAALSAVDMLGEVDAMKLRSCLTLFRAAGRGSDPFDAALTRFYGGEADARTTRLLRDI